MKDEIREKVFTAIGEASMCWEPIPTGVFDSTAAQKVGERLVADLASAVAVEPLAVLADRKGVSVEITPPSFYQTEGEGWDIGVAVPWEGMLYPFDSPTYAECEAKARAYLNGLPDSPTKGEGGE